MKLISWVILILSLSSPCLAGAGFVYVTNQPDKTCPNYKNTQKENYYDYYYVNPREMGRLLNNYFSSTPNTGSYDAIINHAGIKFCGQSEKAEVLQFLRKALAAPKSDKKVFEVVLNYSTFYRDVDWSKWLCAKKSGSKRATECKDVNKKVFDLVQEAADFARHESDLTLSRKKRCPKGNCAAKFFLYTIANKGFGEGLEFLEDGKPTLEELSALASKTLNEILLPSKELSFEDAKTAAKRANLKMPDGQWFIATNCTEGGIYEACAFRHYFFNPSTGKLLWDYAVPMAAKDNYGNHLADDEAKGVKLSVVDKKENLVGVEATGGCCGDDSTRLYIYKRSEQGLKYIETRTSRP